MTQDATNPLAALQATLNAHLGDDVVKARQELLAAGLNPDAKITFDENGDAPMGADAFIAQQIDVTMLHSTGSIGTLYGSDHFQQAMDRLETEGHALLQTAETHVEAAGHTILAIGEHALHPVAAAPHRLDLARSLPLALAGDILHESEHAVIRAFLDAEDVMRRVYLNIHGLWVKA